MTAVEIATFEKPPAVQNFARRCVLQPNIKNDTEKFDMHSLVPYQAASPTFRSSTAHRGPCHGVSIIKVVSVILNLLVLHLILLVLVLLKLLALLVLLHTGCICSYRRYRRGVELDLCCNTCRLVENALTHVHRFCRSAVCATLRLGTSRIPLKVARALHVRTTR